MATKKVTVEVSAEGLSAVLKLAERLNNTLDQAEKPRKIRAASAALSASQPTNKNADPTTGLTRGTAAAKGRGDARDFGREAQGLGGLVHVYATFAANVFAVSAAFTALSKAADFSNMQKAADILSVKVGTSINTLAKDMQKLTDGAISMSEALSQASLGASAGLNTKQIKELTTVAKGASIALGRDLSDAMQRVFRGTIKIEPELLDELGLMVKVDDANKAYAKTLNKTVSSLTDYERRQAFVNAVTTQGIAKYKELANQSVNPYSQLLASIHDLGTGILNVVNTALGPFMAILATSPTALLTGLTAMVALLLKQAVPALSNMRAGWEAADKAAAKSIQNQLDYINQKKQANLKAASAELKASQINLAATTAALEGTISNKFSGKKDFISSMRALTWVGLDDKQIEEQKTKGLANLDKLAKEFETKIKQTQDKLDRTAQKTGTKSTMYRDDQIAGAEARLEKYKDQLHAANVLARDQLLEQSKAAGIARQAQDSIHSKDTEVINAEKNLSKLEKLAERRMALSKAYDVTETLGTRAGFGRLSQELDTLGKEHSKLDVAIARTRGSFGILTTAVSKGLGTFSVWAAALGIGAVALSALFDWLDLTTDKLAKLQDTTDKLAESFKLYASVQEKLSSSGSLAETFTLQASSAQAYAEALGLAAQKAKELSEFREQKGFSGAIDKGTESLKAIFFNAGIYGQNANTGLATEFQRRVDTDEEFSKNNKNITGGKNAVDYIDSMALEDMKGRATIIERMAAALADPKLEQASKEFAESSNAMRANLKDLSDISGEYLVTLQNQSKHLKALNALSSSTSNLFKQLSSKQGGIANLSEFLNGITDQFQEMAGTNLPAGLQRVKTSLAEVQKVAEENYKRKIDSLPAGLSTEGTKQATELASKSKTREIETNSKRALEEAGYKRMQDAQTDAAKYTINASKKLAEFAAATANASVASAALSASLKKTQFIAGLSDRASGIAASEEYKTERKRVSIENKAKQTNLSGLNDQKNLDLKALRGLLLGPTDMLSDSQVKQKAYESISNKNADVNLKGTITAALSRLIGVEGAISIAKADISVNTLGLPSDLQVNIDKELKTIEGNKNKADDKLDIKFGTKAADLAEEFSNISGIGAESVDSLRAYRQALLDNEEQAARQAVVVRSLTESLAVLDYELRNRNNLPEPQRDAANKAIDKAKDNLKIAQQTKQNIKDEKPRIEYSRSSETALKELKDANLLKTRALELGEASGRLNSQEVEAKKIILGAEESLFNLRASLKQQNLLPEAKQLLEADIARVEAARDHGVALAGVTKELNDQRDLLQDIDSIFSANTSLVGLPSSTELASMSAAYREVLQEQREVEESQLSGLSGNSRLIAQEAIRIKYLEKEVNLRRETAELTLKILENKGDWASMFSGEGLNAALDIMASKIYETMEGSRSAVAQLATGIVDSVDTIVDNFATMIQKMDETKLSWVSFRDMVRNTLSDMLRDIAADMLKQGMKSLILSGIESVKGAFSIGTEPKKMTAADQAIAREERSAQLLDTNNTVAAETNSTLASVDSSLKTLDSTLKNPVTGKALSGEDGGIGIIPPVDSYSPSTTDLMMTAEKDLKSSKLLEGTSKVQESVADKFMDSVGSFGLTANNLANVVMQMAQGGSAQSIGSSLLPIIFKSVIGAFAAPTVGSMVLDQSKGFSATELAQWGGNKFAKGGVMSKLGEIPLEKYAKGGIASSPQMALFGEGSKNEAYVPLPDNRSIPVTLSGSSGGGIVNGDTIVNVTVNNSDSGSSSSVSVEGSKKFGSSLAASIKAAVQEELIKQMKPRGMLNA